MDKINNILLKQMNKAMKKDEVPVAAMIINKSTNKIIKTFNKKKSKQSPLAHAEIIAINKMAKYKKDWRLDDCILYVTLEPCNMCKTIINESRIKEVYYITKSTYHKNNQLIETKYTNIPNDIFDSILTKYFKNKRK